MITNHLKDDTTSRYNSSGNVQNVYLSTERLFSAECVPIGMGYSLV